MNRSPTVVEPAVSMSTTNEIIRTVDERRQSQVMLHNYHWHQGTVQEIVTRKWWHKNYTFSRCVC